MNDWITTLTAACNNLRNTMMNTGEYFSLSEREAAMLVPSTPGGGNLLSPGGGIKRVPSDKWQVSLSQCTA